MKFLNGLKALLPHLSIAFSLALLGLAIFNGFNPRMGFLQGTEALVMIIAAVVLSILTAILALVQQDTENQ